MSRLEELARQRRLKKAGSESSGSSKNYEGTSKSASLLEKLRNRKKTDSESPNNSEANTEIANHGSQAALNQTSGKVRSTPIKTSSSSTLGSKLRELRSRKKVEEAKQKESVDVTPEIDSLPNGQSNKQSRDQLKQQYLVEMAEFKTLQGRLNINIDSSKTIRRLSGHSKFLVNSRNKVHKLYKQKRDMLLTVFYPARNKSARKKSIEGFHKPSPDDIVLAAQEQVFQAVTENVAQLSIKPIKIKERVSKRFTDKMTDQTKVQKQQLTVEDFINDRNATSFQVPMFGLPGSGKSTILGQLSFHLGLTTREDIRVIKTDMERMHFRRIDKLDTRLLTTSPFCWVVDETTEERQFGHSNNIKPLHIKYNDTDIIINEVPGSFDLCSTIETKRYVGNSVIIVVSAELGDYEANFDMKKGLIEKLIYCNGVGVRRILTIINKMDLIDWDMDRYTVMKHELELIYQQVGIDILKCDFIGTSAITGEALTNDGDNRKRMFTKGSFSSLLNVLLSYKLQFKKEVLESSLVNSQEQTLLDSEKLIAIQTGNKHEQQLSVPFYIERGLILKGQKLKINRTGLEVVVKSIKESLRKKKSVNVAVVGQSVDLLFEPSEAITSSNINNILTSCNSPKLIETSEFNMKMWSLKNCSKQLDFNNILIFCVGRFLNICISNVEHTENNEKLNNFQYIFCRACLKSSENMLAFEPGYESAKSFVLFFENRAIGFGELLLNDRSF